jgi:mycothiol synthase
MPEQALKNDHTPLPGLTFRGLQGEADFPLLLAVNHASTRADGSSEAISLEDLKQAYAPKDRFDPSRDIVLALTQTAPGTPPAVIGYSRLGWYTAVQDTRVYYQVSFLPPEWRTQGGIWQAMVREADRRLRKMAASHPSAPRQVLQAWASDKQVDWISTLESVEYRAVRHFNNMLHDLKDIPEKPLPPGFEVRPVQPEHMRQIWEAYKEGCENLFENVVEDWTEEKYQAWLVNPAHTPQFWQIAWDGDQVVGMVLARIDEAENTALQRQHGYTEHIFVRRPWQKRGLASALVARSLQVLNAQGMAEAELGVDAENESGAFALYQGLGYKTFYVDTWFRKPMEE